MSKMSKLDLQKAVMLNNPKWWGIEELTLVMRQKLKERGMASITDGTVTRNIRHFKEAKHFLYVEKRKIAPNTFEYRISNRTPYQPCSKSEYAARK